MKTRFKRVFEQFSGDNSECEPPDPISNSEVKPFSADVARFIHKKNPVRLRAGFFYACILGDVVLDRSSASVRPRQ